MGELVGTERETSHSVEAHTGSDDRACHHRTTQPEIGPTGETSFHVDEIAAHLTRGELSGFVELQQRLRTDHLEQLRAHRTQLIVHFCGLHTSDYPRVVLGASK